MTNGNTHRDASKVERDEGEKIAAAIRRIEELREIAAKKMPEDVRDALAKVLSEYAGGAVVIVVPIDPKERVLSRCSANCSRVDLVTAAARVSNASIEVSVNVCETLALDGVDKHDVAHQIDRISDALMSGGEKVEVELAVRFR